MRSFLGENEERFLLDSPAGLDAIPALNQALPALLPSALADDHEEALSAAMAALNAVVKKCPSQCHWMPQHRSNPGGSWLGSPNGENFNHGNWCVLAGGHKFNTQKQSQKQRLRRLDWPAKALKRYVQKPALFSGLIKLSTP